MAVDAPRKSLLNPDSSLELQSVKVAFLREPFRVGLERLVQDRLTGLVDGLDSAFVDIEALPILPERHGELRTWCSGS